MIDYDQRIKELERENAELKAELQRYKDCLEPYCNQTQARAIEDMVKRPTLPFIEGTFTEIAMDYAKRLREQEEAYQKEK